MAVAAMLSVQLSNALSVPVIDQVGAAGTAWLRMCFGVVLLPRPPVAPYGASSIALGGTTDD